MRGEVWWAQLPEEPAGSAPGYKRPVVIVSADRFNDTRLSTVVVAVITGNTDLANAPGNVLLRRGEARLPKASVVNISQLYTIDKGLLIAQLGVLAHARTEDVDAGLRLVLGL